MVPQDSVAPNPFTFSIISISLVKSHLKSLDITKSTGPDNLSAKLLRTVADQIAAPLTDLFNSFLQNGEVPSEWKHSHIIPVHKGDLLLIQVTSGQFLLFLYLLRFLRKLCLIQLSLYFEDNHLLHPHQGAYRSGKSILKIFCWLLLIILFIC